MTRIEFGDAMNESLQEPASDSPPSLRVAVVGSGAIGGLVGVKLALSGNQVTFIDKGAQLKAIQAKGLRLKPQGSPEVLVNPVRATEDYDEAGPQDLVILGLKAHHIQDVAAQLPALLQPDTIILTLQNGIPWWYFQRHGGRFEGSRLRTLDPTGVIEASIDPARVIGCVAYPAAAVPEPGFIKHIEGDRLPIGELDGTETDRSRMLLGLLTTAGFRSRVISDIRAEIWLKAWGTLSLNPISALTHATMEQICRFPETRNLTAALMREAEAVATNLGIRFRHTIERRIVGAESVGTHRTSMLQDVEAGRELEADAIIGAVIELGEMTGIPTPTIGAIHALVKLLERTYSRAQAGMGMIPANPPPRDTCPPKEATAAGSRHSDDFC